MDETSIKSLIKNLLDKLDIVIKDLKLTQDDQDSLKVDLKVSEADTGILIGYHGDTIAALQLILGLLAYKQTGSWTRLIVNVGDYRQKRQEALEKMAQSTVQRVKFSGEPIALFNLNPFERHLIHEYLTDHADVTTESQGEGRNRHLIVRLKDSSQAQVPPPTDDQAPPTQDEAIKS